jgi:chromosomal replication initiator protein
MDIQKVLNGILEDIKPELSSKAFATWFKNTELEVRNDDELVVYAGNDFAADWVRKNYIDMIRKSAVNILHKNVNISVASRPSEKAANI